MVLKPAMQTPLTALALAALARRSGVPDGVLNVVMGSAREISFTGSTEVGRLLMQQGAATVKKMSMELRGNAPFIVFDDADVDAAVNGAILSKYRNSGSARQTWHRRRRDTGTFD
jgi:succinate-semialdehyde dehydrogenase / glutarate-semialdehyde dehydrogenase